MFFNNNKNDLEKELSDLNYKVFIAEGNLKSKKDLLEDYDYRIKTMKADLESLSNEVLNQSEFVIDFVALKPFSIERILTDGGKTYKTVIGYFLTTNNTKEVKEWHLYCNLATHNRLASEFKLYLESKNPQ